MNPEELRKELTVVLKRFEYEVLDGLTLKRVQRELMQKLKDLETEAGISPTLKRQVGLAGKENGFDVWVGRGVFALHWWVPVGDKPGVIPLAGEHLSSGK